jgi:hypothetical protein
LVEAGRQEAFIENIVEPQNTAANTPNQQLYDPMWASCRPPSSHSSSLPDSGGTQEGFCGITGGLKYAYGLKQTSVDRR